MRFVHIVNPYDPGPSDKENRLQQLTFSSLITAAKNAEESDHITLCAAIYKEDESVVPPEFVKTKFLERSIRDVSGIRNTKRLPLLQDILDRLNEFPDADYFVYTNMDILLAPQFYQAVSQILRIEKQQALIINRRRIEEYFIDKPAQIFSQDGMTHPGYDCFVFHRSLLNGIDLGETAVGVPGIGFILAHNLFLLTDSCSVLTDKHLTYHLGMEIVKFWVEKPVVEFQYAAIRKFLKKHRSEFSVKNFPGYDLPFFKRHWFWFRHSLFSYPLMFRMDIPELFDGRKTSDSDNAGYSWKETNFTKAR